LEALAAPPVLDVESCTFCLEPAGAPKVNVLNYTQPNGFMPFSIAGVVRAASSVFFA